MENKLKILIVEDNECDAELVLHELRNGLESFVAMVVDTELEYVEGLKNFVPNLILSDFSLPLFCGSLAFEIKEKISPQTLFIFVTGTIGEEKSVELIKKGVTDFVLMDKLFTLNTKVNRALAEAQSKKEKEITRQQLIKSEKYFRSIMQNCADGIAILDGRLSILDISPNCKSLLGYERNELIGDFKPQFIHPEDIPIVMEALSKTLDNPEHSYILEYRYKKKEGEFIWMESSYINRLEDPEINGIIVNYRDISQKKQVEERIRKINFELEERVNERTFELREANKALEAFSYSVSHDLQAPLRVITGFIKLMEKEYEHCLSADLKELLNHIKEGANRMSAIVQDLLSLAKYEKKEMARTLVDMTALFEKCWDDIKLQTAHLAVLELETLPQVWGDSSLMEQVVVNLLSNAVKYSSKKGKPIVKVGCLNDSGCNIFFVQDNGVGFNMTFSEKLFEPFHRLHPRSEFEGTGIGLAIVKRIINRHQGEIWAQARENEGATFYVSLPLT